MRQRKIAISLTFILLVVISVGTSYSLFYTDTYQSSTNKITTTECFNVSVYDLGGDPEGGWVDSVELTNQYPIPDEEAMDKQAESVKVFTVQNMCDEQYLKITLGIQVTEGDDEFAKYIKVNFTQDVNNAKRLGEGYVESTTNGNIYYVYEDYLDAKNDLDAKSAKNYYSYLWFDEDMTLSVGTTSSDSSDVNADQIGKTFKGKIVVKSEPAYKPEAS